MNKVENTPRTMTRKVNKNNKSGFIGVRLETATQKWRAEIRVGGKGIFLGRFETIEEAIESRLKAEEKFFSKTISKPKPNSIEEVLVKNAKYETAKDIANAILTYLQDNEKRARTKSERNTLKGVKDFLIGYVVKYEVTYDT